MRELLQKNKQRIIFFACLLLAAGSCLVVLYYIALPSRTTFYADTSDTLYWANAAHDAGRLLSPDFYYPTLQPFGGLLLMLPFITTFGFSLTTHLIGMLLFAGLFMLGTWFFCSSLEIGTNGRLLLFSSILLLLSSSPKLRELLWEHVIYYSLGILFSMLFLGLCFRLYKALGTGEATGNRRKIILFSVLLMLLAAGVATDGFQVMAFCTVPMAGALLAQRFFSPRAKLASRGTVSALYMVGLLAAGSVAGSVILYFLAGDIRTSYTDQHMVFTASANWAENIMKLPDYWARLLGFNAQEGQNILSLGGLFQLIYLLCGLLLVAIPFIAMVDYRNIKDKQLRLLLWYHGILSAILLFSHIVGSTANAHWRFTPVVFSAIAVTVLYLRHALQNTDLRRLAGLAGAALALAAALNVHAMLATPTRNGQNQGFYALAHVLQENDLTHGYADYQVSQPVTVLSAGKVKARYVLYDEAGVRFFPYNTQMDWYRDAQGVDRYFLIVEAGQYHALSQNPAWQGLNDTLLEIIDCAPYQILVFSQNPVQV